MGKNDEQETDLTRGLYRRQYAGFLKGRRINSVSLEAEAWFWRVHAVADDFGNAEAEPTLLHAATVGRRAGVTVEIVSDYMAELLARDLVRSYVENDEPYLHITGFLDRQPAGRNGKRVRRVPGSPWDDEGDQPVHPGGKGKQPDHPRGGILVNPGESKTIPSGSNGGGVLKASQASGAPAVAKQRAASGGIRVNPGEPKSIHAHHKHSHTHTHSHTQNEEEQAAPATGPPASRTDPAAALPGLIVFDCVGGKSSKARQWALTQDFLDELHEQFPGVNVMAECRKALGWTRNKRENLKTATGMRSFLWKWMSRAQDRGGGQSRNGSRVTSGTGNAPWQDEHIDMLGRAVDEALEEKK
jgi:hypothetical protein